MKTIPLFFNVVLYLQQLIENSTEHSNKIARGSKSEFKKDE